MYWYGYIPYSFSEEDTCTWAHILVHAGGDTCEERQRIEQNVCIWILDSSVFVLIGYILICHRSLGF